MILRKSQEGLVTYLLLQKEGYLPLVEKLVDELNLPLTPKRAERPHPVDTRPSPDLNAPDHHHTYQKGRTRVDVFVGKNRVFVVVKCPNEINAVIASL